MGTAGMRDALTRSWRDLSLRAAVVISAAVASMTYLTGLGRQPLSWDEAVSAISSTRTAPELVRLLRHTDAPLGAYYFLLHGWVHLLAAVHVAPTEAWLRLPSAAAGVGAVALTALLAGRWFDPRIGLVAGCLLAVHPLAVFYAHDARPYTLAVFLMLGATVVLGSALARPTVLRLAAYGLLLTLSVYAHMFAALAIAGHVVIIVRHRARGRWRFAVVGAFVIAAAVPLVLIARHQTGEIGWIPKPSIKAVASFADRLAGGPMAIVVLLVAIGAAYAVWRSRRINTGDAETGDVDNAVARHMVSRSDRIPVFVWALVPPAVLVFVDFVQPMLVPRYALVAVPAIVILVALGTRRIGGRLGAALIVAVFVAGAVTAVVQQAQPYKYEDFRAATARIVDTGRPGDGVLFVPASMRVGYDHYRQITPGVGAADIALVTNDGPTVARTIGGSELGPEAIGRAISSRRRVYLVAEDNHLNPTDRAKLTELNADYARAWVRSYGGLTVTLYIRDDLVVPEVTGP